MSETTQRTEFEPKMLRRLQRLITWTRYVLLWEQLWPRLWPFLIISSLSILLVLFDLLPKLNATLHLLVLGVLFSLWAGCLYLAFRNLKHPTSKQALLRLEQDSGFTNQPLMTLMDRPSAASTSKVSQTLWVYHQDRMAAAMENIQRPWPRSYLEHRDPYSLRAGLVLLLLLGGIEARFDWNERLARAFDPAFGLSGPGHWTIQAWITPPAHTGANSTYLNAKADTEETTTGPVVSIIQNSDILIRLEGWSSHEGVSLQFGPFEDQFTPLGKGAFSLENRLEQGEELIVRHDDKILYRWPVHLQGDLPPKITVSGKPRTGFRGHLQLRFEATDDFGLKEARLEIQNPADSTSPNITIKNLLQGMESKGQFSHNLAAHPWAGQAVIMTPMVQDNLGQVAQGHALETILPERKFTHPVAIRLIDIRKELYTPTAHERAFSNLRLMRLLDTPQDFNGSLAIYFALKVAADRLNAPDGHQEVATVQSILWESAIHLEEGSGGSARNQLEFMSRQMSEMLRSSNDKAAMEALFEQMRKSLDHYLQQMMKSGNAIQGFEEALGQEQVNMVGRDQLQDMLNKARELMRQGNIKAAQAVMDQFQSILSRLAMQQKIDPKQAAKARHILEKLREIKTGQQNLLDQTFQRSRNEDSPSLKSTKQAIIEAAEQKRLLKMLREEMNKLREMKVKAPKPLGQAAKDMGHSYTALEKGQDEASIQAQMRVLEQLEDGLKNSAQSLARKMGIQPMPQTLPGHDPLGRGRSGPIQTQGTNVVPTEREMHQSREILQELYRRAGQKSRPEQELQYIDRLLDRF
ncbi:DUF4175 family protein [Terasakiella sp. SH-1]|uniref:DUF4175 domain-containing protein n=1 Tax=Terasakiella sp. SH-1 TaxID=2560057 RepID=UPI001073DAA8|nr:DUF4175 family protein [Terasakiella sp. SH-1]